MGIGLQLIDVRTKWQDVLISFCIYTQIKWRCQQGHNNVYMSFNSLEINVKFIYFFRNKLHHVARHLRSLN